MHNDDNNDTDSKRVCLLSNILQELQNAMKRMAPSLLEEDCTYEQWKCVANKGQYQFFVSWLDDKGEQYLYEICNANLIDSSDIFIDQLDEYIFALQMAEKVDDAEVFAADIVDVLISLADAIKKIIK